MSRSARPLGGRQPVERIRPIKADYLNALGQRATRVEVGTGLAVGVALGVVGGMLGVGAAAWIGLPIVLGAPIGRAAQRAAARRVERS